MSSVPKTILDLLDKVDNNILKINEIVDRCGEVSLGVNTVKYNARCASIQRNLSAANRLLSSYCQFLNGKVLNLDTFREVAALVKLSPDAVDTALRIAYLQHNKVQLPKFRIDVLAQAYDFEQKDLSCLEEIKTLIQEFAKTRHSVQAERYFNPAKFKFEFTKADEEEVKDLFSKKASKKDLVSIIARQLIITGLNNLKGELPSGDLRVGNDHPIKGIDYDMKSDSYLLKLNELVGELFDQEDEKIDIKILPDVDGQICVEIEGRAYSIKSPSCATFLDGNTPGSKAKRIVFRDALENDPELFYRVVYHLHKRGSGILVDICPDTTEEDEENLQLAQA